MIQDFIKDSLKYLPSLIAPAMVGLIAIPIVTRLFLPADYGHYTLVMATVSILISIVGWLSMSIIRFYPAYERDGRLKEFYGTVVKLLFTSVATLAIIFLGILFLFKSSVLSQLWYLMLIGTLVFILSASFRVLQHFLRARRQLNWYTGFSIWNSVATLGVGIALVLGFHYGVDGLLWGYVLSLAVVLPLLWMVAVGRKATLKAGGFSGELAGDMAKYGFPLVVGNLASWIMSLSDRYVLGFFRRAQEVGIYSASYIISEHGVLLPASLFMLATRPILMSIWEKQGIGKSQEFVSKFTRYYLMVCLPAAVGLAILAKPAIGVLTASEYHEGYRIVALVAFSAFFFGLYHGFQSGLILYKKTYLIMIVTVISGLLNLGLNFWLVPRYSYMAAAVTTFISYAFLLAAMIILSRRYFVWEFPFKSLGKIALASAVMAAAVYPVGNGLTTSTLINLILGIIVGVVVYLAMLFLLREPRKEEVQELRAIVTRIFRKRNSL